ncbi:DNA mismatch repair protein MutL [Legionella fallonii LLAP-10]|uniref:DNA mismatch repair protein MutL n=2 Tax=Legionella fallonii TaxID=96230 RepID=A0A098G020_9GAMM|nr:DNA mismatch repair protein MutL [Legionella fallonii LLAP-10]
MRIHQLSSAIANQIAAGEVIERPASVVKELLENSLDAGADAISIEIGYGGLNQIKISDNGHGIIAEDLPLAVAAHATSKITTLDDLYAINSMGFRGEALASIASVAKVTISSKTAHQEHAMMLQVQNGQHVLSPCARTIGTTIDVVDLFFNAPVRKRFLKNEKLEFQAIELVIKRFALSAPHINLIVKHNGKLVLSLPAAIHEQAKRDRMAKIFGSSFIKDAIYLDVERGAMRLYGWISGPNYQRSQNDRQWVYINQRMIKDKLINHALKQTYDGMLYPGRFPACLLYFTINTAEVDVNVHPTKHEVRFQQPRLVHDFFTSQLSAALQSDGQNNTEQTLQDDSSGVTSSFNSKLYDVAGEAINMAYSFESTNKTSDVGRPYRFLEESDERYESNFYQNKLELAEPLTSQASYVAPLRPLGSAQAKKNLYSDIDECSWVALNNQYSLVFIEQQPYIVDVLVLQQKWLLEQLQQASTPLESRPLLVPVRYSLSLKLKERIEELQHYIEQLGIRSEWSIKEDKLLIRSIPIYVPYLDLRLFLEAVADLQCIQISSLLELMSQMQRFDPKLLAIEERMALNQFLLKVQNQKSQFHGVFKALSADDCRMLLHV